LLIAVDAVDAVDAVMLLLLSLLTGLVKWACRGVEGRKRNDEGENDEKKFNIDHVIC
jgi:hypothetical protein